MKSASGLESLQYDDTLIGIISDLQPEEDFVKLINNTAAGSILRFEANVFKMLL